MHTDKKTKKGDSCLFCPFVFIRGPILSSGVQATYEQNERHEHELQVL
jgi:hypothetical protein